MSREGDEHFSVDGTLIKAWASMKSFQSKASVTPPDNEGPDDPRTPSIAPDTQPTQSKPETEPMPRPNHRNRNAEVDFKGEKRSNATHASTTDPEARLYKKSPGAGATLCFMGHALMENRHGLVVQGDLTQADGYAERRAALDMVHRHSPGSTRRLTLGADKGYDAAEFVSDLREACVTPHVAQKSRYSAIPSRQHAVHAPAGQWTGARRDIKATPCRSSTDSGSRKPSAGPRPSAAWRKPSIAASNGCDPASS